MEVLNINLIPVIVFSPRYIMGKIKKDTSSNYFFIDLYLHEAKKNVFYPIFLFLSSPHKTMEHAWPIRMLDVKASS